MNEIVIQRNLKGLKTEYKNTNDSKFERILQDDRGLDFVKFKVGAKFFKVQLKDNVIIYSLIVSVPDTTNDLGYYSINIFSDSLHFIKNYKDILEAIENMYLATNMRGQDIDSQLSSILSKFLTQSLSNFQTGFVNKVNKLLILDSNKIEHYETPMKGIFVFEAVYYIPTEILNSERGLRYMSNTDRIVKENETNQYYSFIKLSSNNNFKDCYIFIDGKRIHSNDINSNPFYFFLNKNSKLFYKNRYDESKEEKQIIGNDFVIPKFIKPEIKYENQPSPKVNDSFKNEINKESEQLRNNRILSAILGVLLLVSLIGNGWFIYNYLNPKQEEQNTSDTEFIETTENHTDSTKNPASNDILTNSNPENPKEDTSKKKKLMYENPSIATQKDGFNSNIKAPSISVKGKEVSKSEKGDDPSTQSSTEIKQKVSPKK